MRVIGSSSARIKKRLADGDVIVVEVIRGTAACPMIPGCTKVVVGLITCERVVLGNGAKVLMSECAQEFVHHTLEDEVDEQEEGQDDKREDGEQRQESGVAEESQNKHIMGAWMTHEM